MSAHSLNFTVIQLMANLMDDRGTKEEGEAKEEAEEGDDERECVCVSGRERVRE